MKQKIDLQTFLDRLFETEDGCLEYGMSRNSEGYGNIWTEGVCKKAHRVAWELIKGPIAKGLLVLHTCDNPPCCNTNHLYLGSDADNSRDKVVRGRMADTFGANNPSAFVLEKDVRDIHALLRYTTMTQQAIADKYRLTKGHINNIKAGRAWPHIQREITHPSFVD